MGIVSISTKTSINERKQTHLDVCKTSSPESTKSAGFEELQLVHNALPELSLNEIDTSTNFLGKKIRFPLFFSCMTGGSAEGKKANHLLAKVAEKFSLPFGLGSIRVALEDSSRLADFSLRKVAPTIPIMANLGAQQLQAPNLSVVLKELDVDALVVHLNCGQELFQKEGDVDFRGLFDAIKKTVSTLDLPIIVKETGFGISYQNVQKLIDIGVSYVDLAGSGGTNWILVENKDAKEFADWGLPTAPLLDACRDFPGKILASGGIRSGLDIAKAIALGAEASGMALPLIQLALNGGQEAVENALEHYESTLQKAMLLTGSQDIETLKKTALIRSMKHRDLTQQLKGV
jgi:isopentenyl-diphosphate delta-isomerase type 2